MIRARVLHAGEATAEVLALTEPLSLWGGFDPKTGAIIDVHHPQRGLNLAGKIVLMAQARGSGTAPGSLAEAFRRGTGPAALIMVKPDINLAIGAEVAYVLYGRSCPLLAVARADFDRLSALAHVRIARDGTLSG